MVVTGLSYMPCLTAGFVNIDDNQYVTENLLIRDLSWSGIHRLFSRFYAANYHPLTGLSNALEYHWFGLKPYPYHLFNLVLHMLNSLLVYVLGRQLLKQWQSAMVLALLFAVHPLRVESVAWISERKDVLYSFFLLLALILYQFYLKETSRKGLLVGTFFMFGLSVLSKSAAVILPLLLFVLDYRERRLFSWVSVLEKLPFLLLSVVFGIINILAQQSGGSLSDLSHTFTWFDRIFLMSYSLFFYLFKAFVPTDLSVLHFYPQKSGGLLPFEYYLSILVLGVIVYFGIYRSRSRRRILVVAGMFFIIPLVLVLQFIPIGQAIVAERYTYLPYFGLFFFWAVLGDHFLVEQKVPKRKQWSQLWLIASVLIIIAYGVMTHNRARVWHDSLTLLSDVITHYPDHYYGYFVRGSAHTQNNDLQAALADYNRSISLNAEFGPAYNNRGHTLKELSRYEEALTDLNRAIELDPSVPDFFNNRGIVYSRIGDQDRAITDFDRAIAIEATFFRAYCNRGVSKGQSHDLNGAIQDFNRAIELNPWYAEAFSNRGNAWALQNNYEKSVLDFTRAIELDPANSRAYFNRGLSYLRLDRRDQACQDWRQAQALGNPAANDVLNLHCRQH